MIRRPVLNLPLKWWVSPATVLILLVFGRSLSGQTHFTLPASVWRVTAMGMASRASWIRGDGKEGFPEEYFTLHGYGKRYYDHLLPTSDEDLVGLGDLYISAFDRVDRVIQDFNASPTALAWGDTLADFTRDFFGPDSVVIGGYITNPLRERTEQGIEITLEYGITDRMTFTLSAPYFLNAAIRNVWEWERPVTENAELADFVLYHETNRVKFDSLLASQYFGSLDQQTAKNLQTIYNAFYTTGGRFSVIWALEGGIDPFGNGIYGAQFNPLSKSDTVPVTIDSILAFYHPDRSTTGLGDLRWGLNFLIRGSPAWAGESMFSVYGGIGMIMPTARIIRAFDPDDRDESGRPGQFNELPLGEGVTRWRFSLFGEFYTEILRRLVRINWRLESILSIEGKFWPRLSPRGLFTVDHDLMLERLGEVYRFKPGNVFAGEAAAFLELIPHRLSLTGSQNWIFKQRDRYYADSEAWNKWMSGGSDQRLGYDTKMILVTQELSLIFHNIHPLKKFGPIPFELEVTGLIPIVTQYGWSRFYISAGMAVYFQLW